MIRGIKKTYTHWLQQKWGSLILNPTQSLPTSFSHGVKSRFNFLCDCGRSTSLQMYQVSTGGIKSCGKCSWLSKNVWLTKTWGKLRLDPTQSLPNEWATTTTKKFVFLCTCGRNRKMSMAYVQARVTCGNCTKKETSFWFKQRWGSLRLSPEQPLPSEFSPKINKKLIFLCDCGRQISTRMDYVTGGGYSTCGKCSYQSKLYWLSQKWGKLRLVNSPNLPDEWPRTSSKKFCFLCECGTFRDIIWSSVTGGLTLSCGCLKPGTSEFSPAHEIFDSVVEACPDAKFNYWFTTLNKKRVEFDIYVPSKALAIEYHGLYWHKEDRKGKSDSNKYALCKELNVRLIQIYQDEWEEKKEIMLELLHSLLSPQIATRLYHLNFSVERDKTSKEARAFLDSHHYLGAASGCLTVIARRPKTNQIVGVWVFQKRETGTVLWHRACWDHNFKAWNPHEKALKLAMPALREMGFKRVLTFADNRFHTGELYTNLGFTFEKEIPPNYYYTNGFHKRKSKYSLRVKAGVDEVSTAKASGWHRIWDSGKKRFYLPL
jgi:hypothetical protein